MKLLVLAILSVVAAAAIIIYSDRPSTAPATPIESPAVTHPIKVIKPHVFKVEDVSEVTWKYKNALANFKKNKNQWVMVGTSPAAGKTSTINWAMQRRLVILSQINTGTGASLANADGQVTIKNTF